MENDVLTYALFLIHAKTEIIFRQIKLQSESFHCFINTNLQRISYTDRQTDTHAQHAFSVKRYKGAEASNQRAGLNAILSREERSYHKRCEIGIKHRCHIGKHGMVY